MDHEELLKQLRSAQALCVELCTVALHRDVQRHLPFGCRDRVENWLKTYKTPEQL